MSVFLPAIDLLRHADPCNIASLSSLNMEEGNHRAYWSSDTTSLFLGASAFNHACGANALRRVTKHYVTIRARKPIKTAKRSPSLISLSTRLDGSSTRS